MASILIAPELVAVGVVPELGILTGTAMVGPSDELLTSSLREAEAAASAAPTPPQEVAPIAATRQAYRRLGKDPSRYRPSAEALLRRCRQGKALYLVNILVDLGNLLSLRTGISIGIYDRSRIDGEVVLRPGRAGETYAGVGKGDLNLDGLPLLSDDRGAFGSPTSDSERTRVEPGSVRFIMVLYGFAPAGATAEHRDQAVALLKDCGIAVDP